MHADEANQAVKLGQLLERGEYRYDPQDHHGPTLYYFAWFAAKMTGAESLAELSEKMVRLTPAIAGFFGLALLWLLTLPMGRYAALPITLLFAISPAAVYYSRYFIQETLLTTFTLVAWWAGANWLRSGNWRWAIVMGIGSGMMLATKVSATVMIVVSLLAACASDRAGRLRQLGRDRRAIVGAGFATCLVASMFYCSFGRNAEGLWDALVSISSMGSRALGGSSGHEKPWWYYGSLFVFQRTGGYVWDQTVFLILAIAGGVSGWKVGSGVLRFACIYVALLAVTFSVAPYKTPWIVVNLLPGLCILGGGALPKWRWPIAVAATIIAAVQLGHQTWRTSFSRPADARNPYAYQHTAADMLKLQRIEARAPAGTVKVISPEYWPIPWYLRARSQVGYWATPPHDCDGALVIVSAEQAEAVRSRLKNSYDVEFLGLRPGFTLVIFTRERPTKP